MEVEKLRSKAETVSSANAAETSTRPGSAGQTAADLMAPELMALDEWMEDLRVLGSDSVLFGSQQDRRSPHARSREQGQVKAVASPMRVRNPAGPRSPSSRQS